MRLLARDLKTLYLRRHETRRDAYGGVISAYAEPTPIQAALQPLSGAVAVQAYGLSSNDMLLLLYDGQETLRPMDGLDTRPTGGAQPEYQIEAVRPWQGFVSCDLRRVV